MKSFVGIIAISAGLMVSTAVRALPMELESDGIKWSWTSGDIGATSGLILLSMDATGSSLSNAAGTKAYLHSFMLQKGDGAAAFTVTSASATSTPTEDWTFAQGGLAESGCNSAGNGSAMCFKGVPGLDIIDEGTQSFTVLFDLSSGVLSDTLHLKILWVTTPQEICTQNGNSPVKCGFTKVGDLISQDFQQTPDPDPDPDPDPHPVPLPDTLGLLGLGLLTMSQRRRRKHSRY